MLAYQNDDLQRRLLCLDFHLIPRCPGHGELVFSLSVLQGFVETKATADEFVSRSRALTRLPSLVLPKDREAAEDRGIRT